MENNSIKFDKDTPAIVAANKVQSMMAVNNETGEVGNVEFDLLVQEAGKHVADAVKVVGNVLPTLGDVNKRYSFTTGSAGRTLTHGSTSFVYGANKQCSAFWDGVTKVWSKEDEVGLPTPPPVNTLDSTSTTESLSANMGRELDVKILSVVDKLPTTTLDISVLFANSGKYLNGSNGRMIDSSLTNAKVSNFIPISDFGDFLSIGLKSQINGKTACAICYYSSDIEANWISSQFTNTTGTSTVFEGQVIIPPTATHVRLATYNSDLFKLDKLTSDKTISQVDFDNKIGEINNKLPKVWGDTGITLSISGSVVNINGNSINSGAGRCTDFILIDRSASLKIKTLINSTTVVAVAFYETNAVNPSTGQPTTFISAQGIVSTAPQVVEVELVIPLNANYYKFSGYSVEQFALFREIIGDVASQQDMHELSNELQSVKENVGELDIKKLIGATVQSEEMRYREARNINIANSPANPSWYGVEFIEEDPNKNNVTRIGSGMGLHNKSMGLPIQKKLRRCVMNTNGTVNYYLGADNSNFKADGITPAKLDGTDGNVMSEISEHWRKVISEPTTFGGQPATKITSMVSEYYQDDTWTFVQKSYTSAFEATVNWDTQRAASVCTTLFKSATYTGWGNDTYDNGSGGTVPQSSQLLTKTALAINGYTSNATSYRGGTNRASLDNFQSIDDINMPPYDSSYNLPVADVPLEQQTAIVRFIKTGLGRNLSNTQSRGRIFWREKARANSGRHNIYMYDNAVTLYWLATIEYATRDLQQPIISEPDSNGYTQGGLGVGASSMVFNDFEGFKGHPEDPAAVGLLPCGITTILGNNSGQVPYYIPYFPYGTGSGQGGTWAIAGYKPYMVNVMSYRGVENFYGHLYKVMDGINVQMNQLWRKRNPTNTAYESEYGAAGNAKSDIQVFYTPYATAYGEQNNEYYEKLSNILTDDYCIFYIKNLAIGNKGHIIPKKAEGKTPRGYWDITEFYNYSEQQSLTGKVCYMTIAGRLVNGNFCGPLFTFCAQSGNQTRASDTTRLDYR